MTTIEQAEANIKRARELEQAVKDGKTVECRTGVSPAWCVAGSRIADSFFRALNSGTEYRILEPKRRRLFTFNEARVLIGCVVTGHGDAGDYIADPSRLKLSEFWMETMANDKAHYHLPGQPDQLKPCWVEEL